MAKQYNNETGSVTFRLKEPNSESHSRIMGRYSFKNFQVDFSTGLKVLPNQWDNDSKVVFSGSEKREINLKLNKFRTAIIEAHNKFNQQYNRNPTKEELKSIVDGAKEGKEIKTVKKDKKSFDEVFHEFMSLIELKNKKAISSGQKPFHKSYVSSFNVMYADLKDFAKENSIFLDIDKFDETQCLEFQTWLIEQKELELNTVRTRIKRLSQILKRAFEKGYTNNRSYLQDEFSVKVPPTFHAVLTEKEIDILFNYDFFNSSRLEKIRDIFVLGCHTSLRFADLTRIETAHIDFNAKTVNILLQKVSKTDKYKTVNFPFFGYAEQILKKYDGNIKNIAISNQNSNDYLKEVFAEIPYFNNKVITREKPTSNGIEIENIKFSEKIAFHDSRRSFCTNRYIEGWDLLEIWQYTGHTNEGTFKTYFKPTFEHEQIRQENIKLRNEKLQRIDLQAKQINELQNQMLMMKELIEKGDMEQVAKLISLNKTAS